MKTQLSAVDLRFLAKELNEHLQAARLDRAYQMGEKELKIRFHTPGKGSTDLIIAPGYVCMTKFARKVPERPTSFAMQLRKRLCNAYVREVRQHGFDRVLEIAVSAREGEYLLIAEFFSRGNVFLCDAERRILGLLEWQKWKDRTLGVGQTYQYPPEGRDPFGIDCGTLKKLLRDSGKKLASTLATDAGLGGAYAEEVCLFSGLEKDAVSKELSDQDAEKVYKAFTKVIDSIRIGEAKPAVVVKDGADVDVVPLDIRVYEGFEKKRFASFNEAVDEFFSREEFRDVKEKTDAKLLAEMEKLRAIERKQNDVIRRFERESVEYKDVGDALYQNYPAVEELISAVKYARSKGVSWEEIKKRMYGINCSGLVVEDVSKEGIITVKTGG